MVFEVNGANKRVSNEEWERYVLTAEKNMTRKADGSYPTEEEVFEYAKQIWLEDNEFEINEEQEELVKATAGTRLAIDKMPEKPKKQRKPREKKSNPDKAAIINILIKEFNATVVTEEKMIEFDGFKFNLVKTSKEVESKEIKKPDPTKVEIVARAVAALEKENIACSIKNVQKLVKIELNDAVYKLDLTQNKTK